METKIFNPLRAGFKITLKIKNWNHRLIQLPWILSQQLIMSHNSGYMHSLQRLGMLLMTLRVVSWGISSLTLIRESVNTWAACDRSWRCRFYRYIMSHCCSVGFGSGKWEGNGIIAAVNQKLPTYSGHMRLDIVLHQEGNSGSTAPA